MTILPEDPSAPTLRELRIEPQGWAPLGAEQQTFNRLLEKLRELRDRLAEWQAFEERYWQQVVARLVPIEEQWRQARRDLILQCDAILAGRRGGVSGVAERRRLMAVVLDLCRAHLGELPGDAAIAGVHDSYAAFPFDEQHARGQDELGEFADARPGSMSGQAAARDSTPDAPDAPDADWEQAEAVARLAQEEREADRRRRQERRARRRTAERAAAAELAAREASQSVRGIYRKLASALHPDRAGDEADRTRRTAIMQRVNAAYAGADLLGLLTLQLEIEQIDAHHLAKVSQARLGHYNQVLLEQVSDLEQELGAIARRFAAQMAGEPAVVTPQSVARDLKRGIAAARRDLDALREHTRAMLDPEYRDHWLMEETRQRRTEAREQASPRESIAAGGRKRRR